MRLLFSALLIAFSGVVLGTQTLDIRMPAYPSDEADTYLCTSVQLPATPLKLIAVEPLSDKDTVHHMLLFGRTCDSAL